MPKKAARTKTFTFGSCNIAKVSPPSPGLKTVNVIVSFEDALKLNMAVFEATRDLNSYNRSTADGKRTAMNLTIDFAKNRVRVNRGSL